MHFKNIAFSNSSSEQTVNLSLKISLIFSDSYIMSLISPIKTIFFSYLIPLVELIQFNLIFINSNIFYKNRLPSFQHNKEKLICSLYKKETNSVLKNTEKFLLRFLILTYLKYLSINSYMSGSFTAKQTN